MKETAVEWLHEEYIRILKDNDISVLQAFEITDKRNQAKQMEKDKHEKFNKFLNDEKELKISDLKTIERIQWYYNTYFNEIFNTKEK
jgi:hypothetical protein